MDDIEIYLHAISKWGVHSQIGMLIEEIGELLTAINKYDRECNGTDYNGVIEEIADAEIMLDQFKVILAKRENRDSFIDVDEVKLRKLSKLEEMVRDHGKKEGEVLE